MNVRPLEGSVVISPCRARLPFRFGIATMTAAPLATCSITLEFPDGRRAGGYSSDLLVPKWFEKNPEVPVTRDWADLLAAQAGALGRLLDRGDARPDTVFAHWLRLERELVEAAPPGSTDLLVRGEGVSLVERAMIDAVCRHTGRGLHGALLESHLGFDAAAVDPQLAGWRPQDRLEAPSRSLALRHTVGLIDALEPGDLTPDTRVGDGLPECLTEDIRAFGLTHFKIKVSGNTDDQIDRLARVWRLITTHATPRAWITLDGNEQFRSIEQLLDLLDRIQREPRFTGFVDALLLIEQPLSRTDTFDPHATRGIERLGPIAPCIIDEADTRLGAFPAAAALGYRGVSVKNCKGVFRALINRARCDLSGGHLIQSGEDLTNLPLIALQQDLATAATLGLRHVERNGHHYFRGLDHLPAEERAWAAAHHADLYAPRDACTGSPRLALRIESGRISTASIVDAPGFGYAGPFDAAQRTPAAQWNPASLA